MRYIDMKTALFLAVLSFFCGSHVMAAGLQLGIHSGEGLGRAFAGESASNQATSVLRNPASIMHIDDKSFSLSMQYVELFYEIDNKNNSFSTLIPGYEPKLSSDLELNENGAISPVPSMVYVRNFGRWGFALSNSTDWAIAFDPKNFISNTDAYGDFFFAATNITGNFAYQVTDRFSAGFALAFVPWILKVNRRNGELGYLVDDILNGVESIPFVGPGLSNAISEGAHLDKLRDPQGNLVNYEAFGYGFGWNIGLNFMPDENNRFTYIYHDKIDMRFKGDYESSLPDGRAEGALPLNLYVGTGGETFDGEVRIELPRWMEFAGWHRVADDWEFHWSSRWTNWKRAFDGVTFEVEGNRGVGFKVRTKNSMLFSAGVTHTLNDKWKIRSGVAFDEAFSERSDRRHNAPDEDRWWFSGGATYQWNETTSFDVGASYIRFKDSEISEVSLIEEEISNSSISALQNLGLLKGEINSDTKAYVIALGAQFNKKF